jgi:cation diffusion facilitator family transporter
MTSPAGPQPAGQPPVGRPPGAGPQSAGPQSGGSESAGSESAAPESAGHGAVGPQSAGAEPAGAEPAGPQPAGPQPAGAEPAGAEPAGPEPAGPEPAGHGAGGLRAVLAALAANLGIAATKFAAFAITGSASLLAEAVHSVADCGNQMLLLLGRNRAARGQTEEHPFGYGRERYFYAFLVAVVLLAGGAAFSIYEGIRKIAHPEPIRSPAVALGVLAIAIVLEGLSLRTAIRHSRRQRGRLGWLAFIRHAKAPELPTVLLEDTAALAGLAFATAGVTLTVLTGSEVWDGLGSLAIGVLLAAVAVVLAVETKSLLIGEAASAEVERAIVAALEAGPEVQCVIHLRTLHIGPESLLVAAKIAVRGSDQASVIAAGIDEAERRIRAAVPIAEMIYLEPDLYESSRADTTDPAIRAVRRPAD